MEGKKCIKCGNLAPIDKIRPDFTSYKCEKCGQSFAIINNEKYPHGV
tara:strand:+ start:56 stop:196 length:141 start_codon:yes stop_codon:yes gene_type:complete